MALRIALAQMNPVLGDFAGNSDKIVEAARIAHGKGAHLLLTPELALTGFPPEDLLLRPDFNQQSTTALELLAQRLKIFEGLQVIVGHPHCTGHHSSEDPIPRPLENPPIDLFNSASQLIAGRIAGRYDKRMLPTTQVFDEYRYFVPGHAPFLFDIQGVRCALLICEDAWTPTPMLEARAQGAQLMLVLNGSPWHEGKMAFRLQRMRAMLEQASACEGPLGLIYLNLVGGQDELVFDGGSFALDSHGACTMQLPQFEEAIGWVECEMQAPFADQTPDIPRLDLRGACSVLESDTAQLYQALVVGVRDYMRKSGFKDALIGLSGGVDSALTLVIACDALGAKHVHAVMMPSQYTAQISLDDARTLAQNLGVQYTELPVTSVFDACRATLSPALAQASVEVNASGLTEENLQARIRGMFLMALANQSGALVLTTGNKSEMAVGYCTLYGDMAGGFAVLKDVFKTSVYALCHYRNAVEQEKKQPRITTDTPLIPLRILTRAPSAELRDNQTDQDSLPAYATLDVIVKLVMEEHAGKKELLAAGYAIEDIDRVLSLLWRSEYKRYQAPPGTRVTRRGFGRDWRYPLSWVVQE